MFAKLGPDEIRIRQLLKIKLPEGWSGPFEAWGTASGQTALVANKKPVIKNLSRPVPDFTVLAVVTIHHGRLM